MKTALEIHLHRLARQHGSWSRVAKALGLDLRNLRRNRNKRLNQPTRRVLLLAGKHLALRLLLRELRSSGAVTPGQIKAACRRVSMTNPPSE